MPSKAAFKAGTPFTGTNRAIVAEPGYDWGTGSGIVSTTDAGDKVDPGFGMEEGMGDDTDDEEDDPLQWMWDMNEQVNKDLLKVADDWGISRFDMHSFYRNNVGALNDDLLNMWLPLQDSFASWKESKTVWGMTDTYPGSEYYTSTAPGQAYLKDYAMRFFEQKSGIDFSTPPTSSGSGQRSGGGAAGPTEEDIRNMFDLGALATAATNIWRGLLLEEPEDSRGLARAYVDSVVAGKGEKEIDFTECILESEA